MRNLVLGLATVAVLAWMGTAQADSVKLEVKGAFCPGCAGKLNKSLSEVAGVKTDAKLKATKEEPQFITIEIDPEKADIGDVGKAIANTDTPHKAKVEPAASVVIPVKGLSKDDSAKVQKALGGVKGVVAKEARAEKGEAVVPLDPKGGAKLSEIKKALNKLAE